MLQNAAVRAWLGGVDPAWTLLDGRSFDALQHTPPSTFGGPIRLAANLSAEELRRSPFHSGMVALLRAGTQGDGLRLTATGNLSRAVVAEMIDHFLWPAFDRAEAFRLHKVVNEPDFFPLHLARQLAETTRLLRRLKGHLKASPRGRSALEEANLPALAALLFHFVMWKIDLSDLGRGLHGRWPQGDIGVVLWSLSVAAGDWQAPERLTRLCTIPINGVLESTWDSGSLAMEARILKPLLWFGLLEHRREPVEGKLLASRHLYRKTELFDRFVAFAVKTEADAALRH
ncbi:hypothetical protein ACLF3G_26395 [Falsiroseomonas sp. HC035]|uniref:hypothetical protein n=1 Tax=Falsiroseomonas sp. HC035 TaxID=3390999 RepID=UPI003D314467